MDIGEAVVDVVRLEDGAWVGEKYGTPIPGMGDLCLKVKGSGNKAWDKLSSRLVDSVPRNKKVGGRVDPNEVARITGICLREAGVLDWENMSGDVADIMGKKEPGAPLDKQPLPFSKEVLAGLMTNPKYVRVREAALWACNIVAEKTASETDDDAKN